MTRWPVYLKGVSYTREKLTQFLAAQRGEACAPWQTEIFDFLDQWLAPGSSISVQTSGSTGPPKPIWVEKQRMVASARATGAFLQLKPGSRALLCLPARYIAGKMMIVRALVLGLDLHWVAPSSQPLENTHLSFALGAMVPQQVMGSLDRLHQVQTLLIGGGPIPDHLQEKLRGYSTRIFHTYGMTETLTHVAMRRVNHEAYESDYRVLPGVHLSQDERGCLVIDAPAIAENPVITHDLVSLTGPGRFRWLGRQDFVVNSGGIKLIPEQIEEVIGPFLAQRFFVGPLPDPVLGQKLVLILEGTLPTEETLQEIYQAIRQQLGPFHVPKSTYALDRLDETPTSKILRDKNLERLIRDLDDSKDL